MLIRALFRVLFLITLGGWVFFVFGCGRKPAADFSPDQPTVRDIHNGTPVAANEFSYVRILGIKRPSKENPNTFYEYYCTGTLIGPHTVITAAHCLYGTKPDLLSVAQTKSELFTLSAAGVRRVVVHPLYSPMYIASYDRQNGYYVGAGSVDLSMVTLDRDLPGPYGQLHLEPVAAGTILTAVGYGQNGQVAPDGSFVLGVKLKGLTQLIKTLPNEIPNYNGSNTSGLFTPNGGDVIVAANADKQHICEGDSGGPSLIELNGQFKIASVTSAYTFWDTPNRCVDTIQTLHMRLSTHRNWIETQVMLTNEPPSDLRFVRALYRDVLGREGEPGGINGWVRALANGAAPGNVTREFLTSRENRTNTVNQYYRQFLGREADPGGLNGWVNALVAGVREEEIIKGFIASPEYYERAQTRFNRPSRNGNFVEAVYTDLLGRPSDPDGYTGHVAALDRGAPRSAIAHGFVYSPEYRVYLINRYYNVYLRRDAERRGLVDWANALLYMTREEVQAAMTGNGRNGEYYQLQF